MTPDEARKRLAKDYSPKTPEEVVQVEKENAFKKIDEARSGKGILPNSVYHFGKQLVNAPEELVHGVMQPLLERDPDSFLGKMSQERGAKRKTEFDEAWMESPKAALAGNFLGNTATLGPGAGLLNKISKWPMLGRVLANAGIGAGLNSLNYVNPGESRLVNAGVGGVAGGLVPELMGAIGKGAGKIYNANKGYIDPIAKDIIEIGKQFNIPVFAGDVSPKGGQLQATTELLEKTPVVSIVPERLAQQKAAQNAATSLLQDSERQMITEAFGGPNGIATLKKIATSGGKRAKEAQKLLQEMSNTGSDWNHIIKTGGNTELLLKKIEADRLYDRVGKLSSKLGNVDISDSITQLDKNIKQLSKLPETNKDAIASLEALRRDLIGTIPTTPPSTILGSNGLPAVSGTQAKTGPKGLTFEELRQHRSTISNKINDYYSGNNALIGEQGVGYLQQLKNSIDKDLEKFATSNGPALANAWKKADSFYKGKVIPYKDAALAKALKSESNPDEIYSMFIKAGGAAGDKGTGRSKKFFAALDPKGKAAVRYGIVKDAMDHATSSTGSFSPAKFATKLEKLEAARDVFFKGANKYEIDGLTKLMRYIERAGQTKSPDTGVKNLPVMIAAIFGTKGVSSIAGGIGGTSALKWLLTSPAGRNILLASSSLDPKSPKWAKLVERTYSYLNKRSTGIGAAAGKTASKYSGSKNEEE